MAINERLIHTAADAAGGAAAEAEQGLILHLDANDVDSYDGDGSVWYDISEHDVTIPLSDNADDLELHLNASDSTSYGGGTTWTDIAGNYDGTISGAVFDIDNGGYFDFNGTDDKVTTTLGNAELPVSNAWTCEVWIKFDNFSSTNNPFGMEDSSSPYSGWSLYVPTNGQVRPMINGNIVGSYKTLTANVWYHITLTYTGSVLNYYVDGEFVDDTTTSINSPSSDFKLGDLDIYSGLDGKIGQVRLYSKALSASEIGQNYRHGRDYIYTDLIENKSSYTRGSVTDTNLFLHYDPYDSSSYGGTGTTITDLKGNNNADLLGGMESSYDSNYGSFSTASGDGITTSGTVSVNPSNGMTIEMWVKVKTDVQNYLFSFDGTNTTYFGFSYRSNTDKITWFYRNSGGSTSAVNSDTIVLNEWTHIVATTNGSSAQFYTNGVLSEETSSSAYNYTYNEDLHFGNLYDLAQNSNSDIGQIRFYKGGLSADDVKTNYDATKGNYAPDLALHFDAADLTSAANTTWTDKVASLALTKNGTVNYDDELGDFIDFGGGYYGNDTATTTIKDSNADFTIEFWYNFDALSGSNALLGIMQDASNRGLLMYFDGSTMDVYNYKNGTMGGSQYTSQSFSTLGISAGKWYHIVHVIDASASIKTYVDGELKATSTSNAGGSHWTAMDGIRIGDMETLSYGIDGKMGQFRIYKGLLTADEVMQNFNFTKNNYPNGYNGTITGATWNSSGYFTYDSTSDKVVIANGKQNGLVPNSSTDNTTLIWARIHSTTAYNTLATGRNQSSSINNYYFRHYNNALSLAIYDDGGTRDINQTFGSLSANTWYLLGFRTTTDGSARVNVITTGSSTFTDATGTMSSYESTDVDFNIGFYQTNFGFDGDIGAVKVYNRYLSDSEITAYFNETKDSYGL